VIYLIRSYFFLLVWTFRLGYVIGSMKRRVYGIAAEQKEEARKYG
jgi:hypothetical protein